MLEVVEEMVIIEMEVAQPGTGSSSRRGIHRGSVREEHYPGWSLCDW